MSGVVLYKSAQSFKLVKLHWGFPSFHYLFILLLKRQMKNKREWNKGKRLNKKNRLIKKKWFINFLS